MSVIKEPPYQIDTRDGTFFTIDLYAFLKTIAEAHADIEDGNTDVYGFPVNLMLQGSFIDKLRGHYSLPDTALNMPQEEIDRALKGREYRAKLVRCPFYLPWEIGFKWINVRKLGRREGLSDI